MSGNFRFATSLQATESKLTMLHTLLRSIDRAEFHNSFSFSPMLKAAGYAHGFSGKENAPPPLHHVKQVHGTTLIKADESTAHGSAMRAEGDGLYTTQEKLGVGVKTADCLPILLAGKGFCAAIHAGWRGLTKGIIAEGIEVAHNHSVTANDLYIAIGPAIAGQSYEIGEDVIQGLASPNLGFNSSELALILSRGNRGKWHADLKLAAHIYVLKMGVLPNQISISSLDTYKNHELHSYRRDGRVVGSNWSWIML